MFVNLEILLIAFIIKLRCRSTTNTKQEVLQRPMQSGATSTLGYATLHPVGFKLVRPPWFTLRGHPPRTRLHHDQASFRMSPAPWSFYCTHYCGIGKAPLSLGCTTNLGCSTGTCSANYKRCGDAQGCYCVHILFSAYSTRTVRTGTMTS
jgi:hypothetical protein